MVLFLVLIKNNSILILSNFLFSLFIFRFFISKLILFFSFYLIKFFFGFDNLQIFILFL